MLGIALVAFFYLVDRTIEKEEPAAVEKNLLELRPERDHSKSAA